MGGNGGCGMGGWGQGGGKMDSSFTIWAFYRELDAIGYFVRVDDSNIPEFCQGDVPIFPPLCAGFYCAQNKSFLFPPREVSPCVFGVSRLHFSTSANDPHCPFVAVGGCFWMFLEKGGNILNPAMQTMIHLYYYFLPAFLFQCILTKRDWVCFCISHQAYFLNRLRRP